MRSEIWIVEWNQLSKDWEVLWGKGFMDLGTTGWKFERIGVEWIGYEFKKIRRRE
jgi:hypothetical protein